MTSSSRTSTDAIDVVLRRLEQVSRSSVASSQPHQNDSRPDSPTPPKRTRYEQEILRHPNKSVVTELQHVSTLATRADGAGQTLPSNLSGFMDVFTKAAPPSDQYLNAFNASLTRHLASNSEDASKHNAESTLAGHTLFTSLDSEIRLCVYGEIITYDLCTLEPEPQGIISLLKLAMSDRAAWMIVAGYYRRKKLAFAAIAVVTSMLDVMHKHGYCDVDLKPAFVILSACETDLSRDPRCRDRPHHAKNAEKWLQKALASEQMDYQLSPPLTEHTPAIKGPEKQNTPPRRAPSDSKGRSDQAGYQRILERENDSLRDRLRRQADSLDEVKSAKRKLENEVTRERDLGRASEKKLRSLEQELETSRQMESYAIAGQRGENEARRKAEARADRDTEARVSMEFQLRRSQGEHMQCADLTQDYSTWSPHPSFEV